VRERTDGFGVVAYLWLSPTNLRAPMNNTRWILAALVAGAAAVWASRSRIAHHRGVRALQHRAQLHTWEGEGGNLAPRAVSAKPL